MPVIFGESIPVVKARMYENVCVRRLQSQISVKGIFIDVLFGSVVQNEILKEDEF